MYRNLEAEIVRRGFSKQTIARMLGIGYNTLLAKMRGEYSFSLEEAIEMKRLLTTMESVEYLFEKVEK